MTRKISLILAATNPRFGIGFQGTMPWKLSKEMKYFREVTLNSTVIMGRKTWDSIPNKFKPLSNRNNIVLSKSKLDLGPEVHSVTSIDEALQHSTNDIFVIGGAQIYKQFLPIANQIFITLINDPQTQITCDTFFELDLTKWQKQPVSVLYNIVKSKVDFPENGKVSENGLDYEFSLFRRGDL